MKNSFKLEDNYNKKHQKKKRNNSLSILIICGLVALVCFGSYFILTGNKIIYVNKKNDDKEYVYTIKSFENPYQENVYDEIPTINLVGEEFDNINESIVKKYEQVSNKVDYDYSYEFNQSDNILALKITYAYYPNDTAIYPIRYFDTYNISLKSGKVLNDKQILKMYKLESFQVNDFLESKFKGFYSNLVNRNFYTEKECNYKCFLDNRGISDNYLNGTSYYIENGSLTVFKYYYIYSDYMEEEYFKNTNYQFIVKK